MNGLSVDTGTKTINELIPEGDVLNIKIKDATTRLPVSGMMCYAYIYSDTMFTSVSGTTDSDGIATMDGVFRGETYDVTCWGVSTIAGFASKKSAVQIHEGVNNLILSSEQHPVDVFIHGRIINENGDELSGMRVSASQYIQAPDCECGGGSSYSDLTDDTGEFEIGSFAVANEVTVLVTDPLGNFARSFVRVTPAESGVLDIGDITMHPGVELSGSVSTVDQTFNYGSFSLIQDTGNWFSTVSANIAGDGQLEFTELVAEGYFNAFVDVNKDNTGQASYVRGWIDAGGNLTAAKSDAYDFLVEQSTTSLGNYNFGEGSTITGNAEFVDGDGNVLSSWSQFVYVKLYVENSEGDWEYSRNFSTYATGEGIPYSIGGLPDGNYKVCFADPWTSVTRYTLVCNGGAPSLDAAQPITVTSGDVVSNVDATIEFRQPEAAPQPVSLDELDPDVYLALEDQIQVVSRNTGETVIQVDPDLAGQWVAAQVSPNAQSAPIVLNGLQSRQSASFNTLFNRTLSVSVTSWLQVAADGTVTIPSSMMAADQQGQIALLGIENNVLGWTDLSASNGGGPGGSGGGNSSNASSDESVETAELTAISDTPVETSASGGVEVQNAAGLDVVVETPAALIITVGLLILAIVGGSAVAVRRGRARNQ